MYKIAIPAKDGFIENSLSICDYFIVFKITGNKVIDQEIVDTPDGCGCKTKFSEMLLEKNVNTLLVGNIGKPLYEKMQENCIKVVTGFKGLVSQVLNNWLEENIDNSGIIKCNNDLCKYK